MLGTWPLAALVFVFQDIRVPQYFKPVASHPMQRASPLPSDKDDMVAKPGDDHWRAAGFRRRQHSEAWAFHNPLTGAMDPLPWDAKILG